MERFVAAEESRHRPRFAAGEGSGKSCHLQRGDLKETLSDRRVGGVTWKPSLIVDPAFVIAVGNKHSAGFCRKFDPGFLAQAEPARFGSDRFDACRLGMFVKKDIATDGEGFGEIDFAMAAPAVTGKRAVADLKSAGAVRGWFRCDRSRAQGCDCGDQFKSRAWRINALRGPVEPSAFFFDLLKNRSWNKRAQVVEIVIGFARERQDFAGLNIEHGKSAGSDADRSFRDLLKIDIDARDEIFAFDRQMALHRFAVAETARIDDPDFASGFSVKVIVKKMFQSGSSDAAGKIESHQIFSGQIGCRKLIGRGNITDEMGSRGIVRIIAGIGGMKLDLGVDRNLLENLGKRFLVEIGQQRKRKQKAAMVMLVEFQRIDLMIFTDRLIDLVEIALNDGCTRFNFDF